jgi:5-methylcytosine-specific restriction enzyme A
MFDLNRVYRRGDLHDTYRGSRQSGISPSARHPLVLLFTGESGRQHGYHDRWEDDGTFRYYGEGRIGDMRFTRGNAAVRDHAVNGKELHLFEFNTTPRGRVRYVGQMVCASYEHEDGVPDDNGNPRRAIVFQLAPAARTTAAARIGDVGDRGVGRDDGEGEPAATSRPRSHPLEDLRAAALRGPAQGLGPRQALRNVYERSECVKDYVRARARGRCEGCSAPAPFDTPKGEPYLESHHTRLVSDEGPDHPAWVIAVCPTCHRRAHYARDAAEYNAKLTAIVNALEANLSGPTGRPAS